MRRRQILTLRPERLQAKVYRMHLRHAYLLCQIVCLSFDFNDTVASKVLEVFLR
jgi:hypothetical protein